MAPLLAAGSLPTRYAWQTRRPGVWALLLAGLAGAAVSLVAVAGLALTGRMIGPALYPFRSAPLASVVLTAVGAVLGTSMAAGRTLARGRSRTDRTDHEPSRRAL